MVPATPPENLPHGPAYRGLLIDHACSGPALPENLIAEARRLRNS